MNLSTFKSLFLISLASLTLAGCPDPTTSTDTGDGGIDVNVDTLTDGVTGDAVVDAQADADADDDAAAPDVTGDTPAGDAPGADAAVDVPTGPEPGEFGWPCTENNECDSGYCIEGYAGKQCSEVCSGSACPSGFTCEQDLSAFPDVIFVCVPSFPRLCYPCNTDDDCRNNPEDLHSCIPTGDPERGSYCGAACAGNPCPDGFVCAPSVGVDGSSSQQCIPTPEANGDPGVCTCSSGAIAAGASTLCARTVDDIGTCTGEVSCGADGLSDCSALVPALDGCDGIDNDCDGQTDNGQSEPCETSNDFGSCTGMTVCDINGAIVCDAQVPSEEICDGVDNDCDGFTDNTPTSGCTDYYEDGDGDGYGGGEPQCLCQPVGTFTATVGGDCDDTTALVSPDELEVCNDVDDNCDGVTDEENAVGCSLWNRDQDVDGFGHPTDTACYCGPTGEYTVKSNTDCDDSTNTVNPGVAEVCDNLDNDCDGQTDEAGSGNCTVYYVDGDSDNYGNQSDFACLCAPSDPYVVDVGGDCNDGETGINPGADESCGDNVDNDCDGQTDEAGALNCANYYRDGDNDDYGVTEDFLCLCAPAGVYNAIDPGDCNDGTNAVNPGVTEVCNGIDDNCDGNADEEGATGCANYYEDVDGDGYGVGDPMCMCGASGTVRALVPGDCGDDDVAASPGLPELCGNDGKDENCDGNTDEANGLGCTPYFPDVDGDGYGDPNGETCLCGPQQGFVDQGGDCDDSQATGFPINPGATETCNAFDDNCNGVFDEGCGLATSGWPTYKYDDRRTGHRKDVVGPQTNTLKWKRTLPNTGRQVETTPLILADGNIIYAYNDKVFKLDYSNGDTLWEADLAVGFTNTQQGQVRAGPTVREGGTIYVPTGNGMSLLGPDGSVLWHTSLGPDPEDAVRGTPTIDAEGNAYFISNKFFTRMDPAGNVVWQLAIPNVQYTPGHAAWNLAQDRMYFTATNHVTYAVEPSGFVAWTFVDPSADIDGSCTVGADGTIYSSMGDFVYKIQDTGPSALQLGVFDTDDDVDACVSIYDDGSQEWAWVKANDNNQMWRIDVTDMTSPDDYPMQSSGSPGSAPVFDSNGNVYIGGAGNSLFHAVNQDTSGKWTFTMDNEQSDGSAAVGSGFVVFADDQGVVYLIED